MTTYFRQLMATSTLKKKKCVVTFVQADRKAGIYTKHFWFCAENINSDRTSCGWFQLIFLWGMSHLHKPLEISGWYEQLITVFFLSGNINLQWPLMLQLPHFPASKVPYWILFLSKILHMSLRDGPGDPKKEEKTKWKTYNALSIEHGHHTLIFH